MRQKRNSHVRKRSTHQTTYRKIGKRGGKNTGNKRKLLHRQTGGFLNQYDFAYAGRDIVNQAGKIAPKIIDQASGEINKIAQQRVDQIV